MKTMITVMILCVGSLLLTGCEYEKPLAGVGGLPLDAGLQGLWALEKNGESTEIDKRMLVLAFSDTEYLIRYPVDETNFYLRGYTFQVGALTAVQLKIVGSSTGPYPENDDKLYMVAFYTLIDDILDIKLLNFPLEHHGIEAPEQRAAYMEQYPEVTSLYTQPLRYQRVVK